NAHSDQPFQLYIEEFEKAYLLETRQYYSKEAAEAVALQNISGFMHEASKRLAEEAERSRKYCDKSSIDRIVKECELQYLSAHKGRIYAEFETMIARERFEDCSLAHRLLSRIPDDAVPLLEIYQGYIASTGRTMVIRMGSGVTKDPREYVDSLIQLQKRYMDVSNTVFAGNAAYIAAVDKALGTIVNDSSSNPHAQSSEVLARYCDLLLKKSTKIALADAEVETKLGSLITIFKYIEDKDVFQKFYSRTLAKRLIFATSVSDDLEASMISRLKEVCGVEYTAKLQRMFTDMTLSSEINTKFRELSEKSGVQPGVDFGALVLTAGSWPLTGLSSTEYQVPQELEKSVAQFAIFYHANHNGRKLSWMWHLSKGDLRLNYLEKRYELNASLYHVGILLLFNSTDSLSVREVREAICLAPAEIKRLLKVLVDVKLLTSTDPESGDESILSLNLDFSSKRTKIRIAASSEKDTSTDVEQTRSAVDEDRRLYIQAAIVRIMKSRKDTSHVELVAEVLSQAGARFQPSVPMVKRCIEQLIDKQYLERSKVNRDRYVYIA
ncbi:Cullin-domain-containing protein, partial [Gonapodya prolifera JEL478]